MPLNKSKGNMYGFITDTWNTIKGACFHDCSYCYMKRYGKLNPVRFDKIELKTDMGSNKFIFVGSSCDMWSEEIPHEWIKETLNHCKLYPDNKYFFQSKNPVMFTPFVKLGLMPSNFSLCTTIETDFMHFPQMGRTNIPEFRAVCMQILSEKYNTKNYVTIEPIIDFEDVYSFSKLIKMCNPIQVNIGADSGGHGLPEPPKEKIVKLISELEKFTKVHKKKNLSRLTK